MSRRKKVRRMPRDISKQCLIDMIGHVEKEFDMCKKVMEKGDITHLWKEIIYDVYHRVYRDSC